MIGGPGLPQILLSRRNLPGCHRISSAKMALAAPTEVAALHHLVTAFSIKKALTVCRDFLRAAFAARRTDASRTHSAKMRQHGDFPDCHDQFVKE
jgi:hypothetical protein